MYFNINTFKNYNDFLKKINEDNIINIILSIHRPHIIKYMNKKNKKINVNTIDLSIELDSYFKFSNSNINIWHLKNLNFLKLSCNLTSISKNIINLENLRFLNLKYNKLTNLPNELFELKYLDTLILDNNKLKKIPDKINKLTNLKYLYLSKNKINTIPN